MRFSTSAAAALAASIPIAAAQTYTTCDPTKKTCPPDTGLPEDSFTSDFTSGSSANASWSAAAYTTITYGSQGAEFSIDEAKQAPTIQTDFYIFFGRIDVKMRAAKGTGIVSSIVFESDDLDEIDWEFLGGNTTVVETNFFGKGNTTAYDRAVYYPVDNPQDDFHTYTVDWNSDRIEWIIDGTTVRTLSYNDPLTVGGTNYPQTPMRLKLGNWCGGCQGEPEGTVQWAGGKTTFDDAPYIMYVESVTIQNYNPGDSYEYSDESGSWQSIKIVKDGKTSQPTGMVSGSASISATQTKAPTASHSVNTAKPTGGAVTKTLTTAPHYGGNTSATGQATGNNGGNGHHTGIATSVIIATTEVPGASPTGGSGGIGGASGTAGSGSSASGSGTPSMQSGTNAAPLNTAATSISLVGLLFSLLWM